MPIIIIDVRNISMSSTTGFRGMISSRDEKKTFPIVRACSIETETYELLHIRMHYAVPNDECCTIRISLCSVHCSR